MVNGLALAPVKESQSGCSPIRDFTWNTTKVATYAGLSASVLTGWLSIGLVSALIAGTTYMAWELRDWTIMAAAGAMVAGITALTIGPVWGSLVAVGMAGATILLKVSWHPKLTSPVKT